MEEMTKEVADHEQEEHRDMIPADQIKRDKNGKRHKPVMTVWGFKRKINPFGQITKYKARLNVHGGQTKEGLHYWDTYAPVVQWFTIRTLMIISILEGLENRCIDFVLAFPQANIKVDIYMKVPFGFETPNDGKIYVLKLRKNLYGLKDASKTFWDKVQQTLTSDDPKFGFKQILIDPCLFYKDDCFLLTYVDDIICFARKKTTLDKAVKDIGSKFKLTDEGNISK